MPRPQPRPASDGTTAWRVRYRIGGRQSSETFYTQQAAQTFCDWIASIGITKALHLLQLETTEPTATVLTPTLDEWAERYISTLTGAAPGTKTTYRSTYRLSFGRLIGGLRIDHLDREIVAGAVTKLTTIGGRGGDGYSDKSIANAHGLLSAMMATAVADGLITSSPCDNVRLPRRTEHLDITKRHLTEADFWAIWTAIGEAHRPLIECLVGTGIRWGELEALTIADLDVERQRLRISKAAKKPESGTVRVIGPTKTRKSNRTVMLDEHLAGVLAGAAGDRPSRERLFRAPLGGPLAHRNFWEAWDAACRKAQVTAPRPRIHDLRHTHASWLIAAGVGMKVVQERLGHESITTTMDLYSHLMPGAQEPATEAMAGVWAGRPRPDLRVIEGA